MRAWNAARLTLLAIVLSALLPASAWPTLFQANRSPAQSEPTTRPASARQTADSPAEDRFMSDEEFLKIGEAFDLDAYIKSANPPTVEEIIESREPIPTLEQILDDLKHPERRPKPPVLSEAVAKQLDEIGSRIEELKRKSALGDDAAAQERALDEAVRLAEQAVQLRVDAGQPPSSYEVVDARQLVATLQRVRALPSADRQQWAAASARESDREALYAQGEYERAAGLARSQLAIHRRLFPGDHPLVATGLNNLAGILKDRGALEQAEPLFRDALAMTQRLFPGDHPDVATCLNNLAAILQDRGALEQAEPLFRDALAMTQRLFPGDHPDVAGSLNNLAVLLQARGALEQAEPLCRDALAMRQRLFPGDHTHVAQGLNNLAYILQARGALEQAEPLYRDALTMRQQLFPGDHPGVATCLNNLAHILEARGALEQAEPLYRDALAMFQRLFLGDHPGVVASLNNLALILGARGALEQAEPLCRDALAMYQRLFPGDHPDVALGLNNLAHILKARGALEQAEPLYRDALAMYQRLFPDDHPDVAISLNNLAYILEARGALERAEPLLRDALAMTQRLFPGDHPDVAMGLNNLAYILKARGRLEQAEPLYRDALAMRQRLCPGDHPYVATGLNNLAGILQDRGALAQAEPLYRDALAMYRRLFPRDHPDVARGLNNLASILEARGALEQAEPLYRDALAMYQRLFPGDHPDVASSLNNLAGILEARGALAQAEPLYREAFEMSERLRTQIIGGEQERSAFAEQLSLSPRAHACAHVLARLNRGGEALGILERGRARAALDLIERGGRDLVAEARGRGDAERLDRALASEAQARIALHDAEHLLAGRRKERAAWEKMTDKPADERTQKLADYEQQITALVDEVKQKRQTLTRAGSDVLVELRGLFPVAQPLPTEELLRGLGPDEAVLCFGWDADSVLVALAMAGATSAEIVVPDKEAVQRVTEQARQVRAALERRPGSGPPLAPKVAGELASTLLPAALRAKIAGARRLIVLPDGPLTGIPLDVLIAADTNSVLAGKSIVHAPSATVYLDRKRRSDPSVQLRAGSAAERRRGGVTAVVLGDPVFDRDAPAEPDYPEQGVLLAMVQEGSNAGQAGLRRGDVLLKYAGHQLATRDQLGPAIAAVNAEVESRERPADRRDVPVEVWRDGQVIELALAPGRMGVLPSPAPPAEGLHSMALLDQVTRGGGEFAASASATDQVRLFGGVLPPLPDSGREARAVSTLLERAGAKTTLLTGADAKVPALVKAVSTGRCRYLHLATHGLMGSVDRPLDASLALTQPEKPTPEDIGFLRLEDLISKWGGRLDGCELVVLSACDTQRGARRGDTVMSLPLGFFFAGARTVIASLWKVDDTATMLLMTRFYENLLGKSDGATLRSAAADSGQAPRPGDEGAGGTELRTSAHAGSLRQPMSKAAALREAKQWLRSLSAADVRRLLKIESDAEWDKLLSGIRGIKDVTKTVKETTPSVLAETQPFEHPFYWSAFILIGDPD